MVYRPDTWDDFNGQTLAKTNLQILVRSSAIRGEPIPHTLLLGGAGLGKSTLARVMANERDTDIQVLNAVALEKPKDLVGPLVGLTDCGVLFLDEIHNLKNDLQDLLLTAMEDRLLTLVPEGEDSQPLTLTLARFTLIGATTREAQLQRPMLDRFQSSEKLELYSDDEMLEILEWFARRFAEGEGIVFDSGALSALVKPSHGVPRLAQRLMCDCRDTALVADGSQAVGRQVVHQTLSRLGINSAGLDRRDARYLSALDLHGRPMGLTSLAALMDEHPRTIEEVVEPWLLRSGYVQRTERGRVVTDAGRAILDA